MEVALADRPQKRYPMPPGIVSVRIDNATGQLASGSDSNSSFEFFASGTEPTAFATAPGYPTYGDSHSPTSNDELF